MYKTNELLGLGDVAFAGLGEIQQAVERAVQNGRGADVAKAIKQSALTGKGKRGVMLSYANHLPEDIRQGLANKTLRMTDAKQLYWVASASSAGYVNVIKTDDKKGVGKSNVSDAKLDAKKPFLVTGIQLLSGVAAASADVAFDIPSTTICNGEFEFAVNSIPIAENAPCQIFNTKNKTNALIGYHELDNPVLIESEKELKFNVNFPAAAAENTWVKLVFHGVAIVPAGS